MTVRCKLTWCPYYKNDFCERGSIVIDENGLCNGVYRHGKPRLFQSPLDEKNYPHHHVDYQPDAYFKEIK